MLALTWDYCIGDENVALPMILKNCCKRIGGGTSQPLGNIESKFQLSVKTFSKKYFGKLF